MNTENKVAKIIKVYAILAGIVNLIFALMLLLGGYDFVIILIFIEAVAVTCFGIYAFGEVIELLHQIKKNTANVSIHVADSSATEIDDLPEL